MSKLLLAGLLLAVAPGPVRGAARWAVAVLPSGTELTLEIAADPAARARGYMERATIGPREGMLFVFDEPGRHAMWMKNCVAALDMLWLDEQFGISEIAADQQPCPADGPCKSVVPLRPARYVLELAAGSAARQGLRPGDRLVILADPALP